MNDETLGEIPIESLNQETPSGYPLHSLHLKVGAAVILMKNVMIKEGLCNGTRMIVTRMHDTFIRAAILYGANAKKEFVLPRMVFEPDKNSKSAFLMKRIQFPFRLAIAMTINKSQGQTFEKIGVWLNAPVCSHGQLYVALSRVKSFRSIKLKVDNVDACSDNRQGKVQGYEGIYTKNIVFRQVLSCKFIFFLRS